MADAHLRVDIAQDLNPLNPHIVILTFDVGSMLMKVRVPADLLPDLANGILEGYAKYLVNQKGKKN